MKTTWSSPIVIPAIFLLGLTAIFTSCNQPESIDQYLKRLHNAGRLNGNVLIVKNGSVLYENAFGYADPSSKTALTKDHKFNIGSVYKEFPAVAIMQLQEQGKLDLDDRLSRHVSGLPAWSEQITIRSLLQYSSGLPKMKFGEHFSKGRRVTDEIIWNDLQNVKELEFIPESDYLYTNYSPMLLIKIVEKIAHQDFRSYVQEHLFNPVNLNQTVINKTYPYQDTTLMAIPFNEDLEIDQYSMGVDWILFSSTSSDMSRWFKKLDSYQIISKRSMQILSEEAIKGDNIQAPLGRCDWNNQDISLHSHHGSSESYECLIRHHKQEELMIVIMTNQKHGNVHEIADNLYELVRTRS